MKTVTLINSDLEAYVDIEDYDRVIVYNWSLFENHGRGLYARSTSREIRDAPYLHQFVFGVKSGFVIDHIDKNGLNDCKSNLRYVTFSQNSQGIKWKNSSSEYMGVTYHAGSGKWRARIMIDRQHIHLGLFKTELEAALKYDEVARTAYGESARTNF